MTDDTCCGCGKPFPDLQVVDGMALCPACMTVAKVVEQVGIEAMVDALGHIASICDRAGGLPITDESRRLFDAIGCVARAALAVHEGEVA